MRGGSKLRETISCFMDDPMNYLGDYFKSDASESEFCKKTDSYFMLLHC
jgi:transposase